MSLQKIKQAIRQQADPERAQHSLRFFKTGKGEYGEGDVFLGLTNPQQRQIVEQFKKTVTLDDIKHLIVSPYHEYRLIALLFLVELYQQAVKLYQKGHTHPPLKKYVDVYLKSTKYVNNWDLVDLSAPKITGPYFFEHQDQIKILYRLAKSKNLWERRIAMLSMYTFIRQSEFKHPLQMAEVLVNDSHDLMHKAVGWMLREIGKQDQAVEENFLLKYYQTMPRTMLRYAIEKFDPPKRQFYMK